MPTLRPFTLAACACASLIFVSVSRANNLTTTVVQGGGANWTAAIWKTNGAGTAVAPVAGNTYECVPNGTAIGNNQSETRIRNPVVSGQPPTVSFPGDSLTLNTNTEIRFKQIASGNVPICNFPGVGGKPGLLLKGGMLNAGDGTVFTLTGKIEAVAGSQSYICPGNNDGQSVDNARGFTISGEISGSGTIAVIMAGTTNPQRISGTDNPFSGQWLVKAGWLLGAGSNSLGTSSSFVMDPAYVLPVPPFSSTAPMTEVTGPAILEPMYDLNSAGTLTLVNGGQMRLHQNCAFTSVTIEGVPLSGGTHYYSELTANYPANFPAGGTGAITVQPYGQLPVVFTLQPVPQVMVYQGASARLTARAVAPGTITYQWRKNGVPLADGGNISGATTATLNISGASTADQAAYTVLASNGASSQVSTAANLSVVTPSGEVYEAVVLANSPSVYYRLNETADPATGSAAAFDFAGGGVGIYGTGVQNGNAAYNIPGPSTTQGGFPGFAAANKAAQFVNQTATSRITTPPWYLNTNAVTLTAWVNPSGPQVPYEGLVFCRGSGATAGLNYSSGVDASGNVTLGYTWNNEPETYRWDSGLAPTPGVWSFVALVISPTNATIYVINASGELESSVTYSHVPLNFAGTTYIANDGNSADGSRTFNGIIDEVAIFSAALTKSQLMALYNAASGGSTFPAKILTALPASQYLYRGQTAIFKAVAGGSEPLTYQWKAGGLSTGTYTNLTDGARFSGCTTANLVISNIVDWDATDYIVTAQNGSGSASSTALFLGVSATLPAENLTLSTQQPGGANWDSYDWSDFQPASVSAAQKPGSTYEVLPGARLRTPETNRTAIFPGGLLTLRGSSVWVNNPASTETNICEIRFKQPNPGRVNFPRLVMSGGQLDAGNDNTVEIGGRIDILTNAPIYSDSGNDRGFYIDAWLTGAAAIEYHGYNQGAFMPNYANNLNIAGTSNTFSGKWNIVLGTLLATGTNALGTNDITIGANGAFEPTYDINNTSGNLFLSGRMYLHQNHTFRTVYVAGVPLNVGTYTFAQLNAAYPANFPASWTPQTGATNFTSGSGSITVLVQPAPVIVQQPVDVSVYPTETAQFSVSAQGTPPLGYRWRKGGAFLSDAGNLSGSLSPSLTLTNVAPGNAGNYDVVVSNSVGSVTSVVAVLTVKPTGPALNLTLDYGGLPIVQAQGLDWNTPTNWSDGNPASLSALANPGSTYTVPAGARLRSPANASTSIFPGDMLTVNGDGIWNSPSIGEIRFKHANPGSAYFKRLVMNGGQLDSGDNGIIAIQGRMDVLANTPIYADSAAGQDRPWQIDAWLTGNGTIEYHAFDTSFSGNLNITGTSNTFSGTWTNVQGVLLGSGPNSLGTNTIGIGPNAALETLYDIYNLQGDLYLDGQMFLHQNDTFHAVIINGTPLAVGTYSFAQLSAQFPLNFPATWPQQIGSPVATGSGSITVWGETPPPVTVQYQITGSQLKLTWSQGTLLEATDLTGPWVTNNSPSGVTISPVGPRKFYKIQVR